MIVMASKKAESGDWFSALSAIIEKEKDDFTKDISSVVGKKNDICKVVLDDMVKVWQKFDDLKIHYTLDPAAQEFARKDELTGSWKIGDKYDFTGINAINLKDRSHEEGRIGDAIRAWFYNFNDEVRFRVVFEFCEGEHYYKYTGWKRTFAQHVLYDAPIDKVRFDLMHEVFMDVFKKWFESHIKKDRNIIVKHVKDTYEKGESFTQ